MWESFVEFWTCASFDKRVCCIQVLQVVLPLWACYIQHSKLPETRVQLTGEPQTACCTRHSCWYQMTQITNCINTENKIKHTKKNTPSLGNTWVNHGSIRANPAVAPVHPMSCSTLPSLCLHCQQSNISHDMSKPRPQVSQCQIVAAKPWCHTPHVEVIGCMTCPTWPQDLQQKESRQMNCKA